MQLIAQANRKIAILEEQNKRIEHLEKWATEIGATVNKMGNNLNRMVESVNSLLEFQQEVKIKEKEELKELEDLMQGTAKSPSPPTSTSPTKLNQQIPLAESSHSSKSRY